MANKQENLGRCPVHHHEAPNPQCLRCFLPDGVREVQMHNNIIYLFMHRGELRAAIQKAMGWCYTPVPQTGEEG